MKFYRISKRDFILTAPERWALLNSGKNKEDFKTLQKLQALDLQQATEDDVARIVGHHGLTGLMCDVCDFSIDEAIIYEDRSQEPHSFCQACFGDAVKVFAESSPMESTAGVRRKPHLSLVKA